MIAITVTSAYSADVTLRWDANIPAPEGYRIFAREGSQSYNYDNPLRTTALTTVTLTGLVEGNTYHFVVRAYEGALESADSEEVHYTPAVVVANPDPTPDPGQDQGGNDGGGTGNNPDPDDDGETDSDASQTDTDPITDPTNTAPDAPVIDRVTQIERVGLTPVLVSGAYFDNDNDAHYQSQWRISTDPDFSTLVLDQTSTTQLTAFTVGEMVLDTDTVYYWQVRFIDVRNGISDWSEPSAFTTVNNSDDANSDGIPDSQAVDETVDVNGNEIPDFLEGSIMTVNTVEGQSIVGIETVSGNVVLVAIKSLPTDTLADLSVKMEFGLVGFKLYLLEGVKTATVKIHFSSRVPKGKDAQLYKYATDTGWEVYPNAVFDPNRKSITLILEDGGMGDEDGVENGVIVDPSGIAFMDSVTSDGALLSTGGASSGGGGGGCFISTGARSLRMPGSVASNAAILMVMILLGAGTILAVVGQVQQK
jgi:hypothetical protein